MLPLLIADASVTEWIIAVTGLVALISSMIGIYVRLMTKINEGVSQVKINRSRLRGMNKQIRILTASRDNINIVLTRVEGQVTAGFEQLKSMLGGVSTAELDLRKKVDDMQKEMYQQGKQISRLVTHANLHPENGE